MSTESAPTEDGPITAAAEFDPAKLASKFRLAEFARAVPVSPSYFSRTPNFNDRYLVLHKLSKVYCNLPVIPAADAERVAWKALADLRQSFGEPVKATDYVKCLTIIKKLHQIHPELKPEAVTEALQDFKRDVQGFNNVAIPIPIDRFGRALGVGKRKASTARAYVIEGDGQVLVNGKSLAEYFGRVHDRESAVWALHAADRIDKYNVWARVEGGGTTGQAEALTLAIAKALLAHEPALKPALRRGKRRLIRLFTASSRTLLTCCFQPAPLPATRGEWRGRSTAVSRRERGRPGSRDSWTGPTVVLVRTCASWDLHGQTCPGSMFLPWKLFSVSIEPRVICTIYCVRQGQPRNPVRRRLVQVEGPFPNRPTLH
jgi:small subunit ribosomal protein S9